jgi:DNA polymerase-3 subunit alpha
LILDPQYDLNGALPMWLGEEEGTLTTQFDKDVLEEMGFVKFDFLNLRNLDTIQVTVDLIARTGERADRCH